MLFKPDENNKVGQLSDYININQNSNFKTWKKYIRDAEQTYIIQDVLGQAMYDELDTIFNDDQGTPTAKQTQLIELVQDCLAYYTLFLAADSISVKVSDAGILVELPDQTSPASQEEIFILKKEAANTADRKAEQTLAYLESNADTFTTWAQDTNPAYTVRRDLIISTAPQLTKYAEIIGNSRKVYKSLRQSIKDIEDLTMKNLMGDAFWLELKTENAQVQPNVDQAYVWEQLRRITAYIVLSQRLPLMQFRFSTDQTLIIPSFRYGNRNEKEALEQSYKLAQDYQTKAESFINALISYLNSNADKFPTWKASDKYTDPNHSLPACDWDYNSNVFIL